MQLDPFSHDTPTLHTHTMHRTRISCRWQTRAGPMIRPPLRTGGFPFWSS